MKKKNQYRSFQVHVAPGVYGGSTLIGAFGYFLSEHEWFLTILVWLIVAAVAYIDRPFRFILLDDKLKLISFLGVLSVSLLLPPVVSQFGQDLGELIGLILVPIVGIFTGVFVYFVYQEDFLKKKGWVSISGQWE